MIGKWKSQQNTSSPVEILALYENTKYEIYYDTRGTVNGDVDEVSIDGKAIENAPITGSIVLSADGSNRPKRWMFELTVRTNENIRPAISNSHNREYNALLIYDRTEKHYYVFESPVHQSHRSKKITTELTP